MDSTHDGGSFRMLTVIDEFTRQCLAIGVDRKLNSDNVLHCLTDLFVQHGPPDHIRSDNGSEFTANAVGARLARVWCEDPIHRTRITLGERLQRELQQQAQRRDIEHGNLLHIEGG